MRWEGTEQAPAAAAPPPPGRAAARGAGGGGSAGRAAGGGEECAREARAAGRPGSGGVGGGRGGVCAGERRNLEPELPGWRRAGLGDVTALESEECRAAGAPCAGPGEVAHFRCSGFGKCLKVRAEEGGRVRLPGVRDVGVEEEKRPQPARPSAAPGGAGRGAGRKKSHFENRRGRAEAATGPLRPWARTVRLIWGKPSEPDDPRQPLHGGETAQEKVR